MISYVFAEVKQPRHVHQKGTVLDSVVESRLLDDLVRGKKIPDGELIANGLSLVQSFIPYVDWFLNNLSSQWFMIVKIRNGNFT